jgi:hypothetical protein
LRFEKKKSSTLKNALVYLGTIYETGVVVVNLKIVGLLLKQELFDVVVIGVVKSGAYLTAL